ncbi:hypothetical protein Dsin_002211 [Dipteronia sinensis]|uniref:O-methyltransferase C-terminal domain-containing protein n=1 Tax=Dipteronia sinensis TaxID=43782 RepID=A0AAE0B6S7_9ROSI|nr:hypothetical protein Dsin_002211 [Dipteronia sinensis]
MFQHGNISRLESPSKKNLDILEKLHNVSVKSTARDLEILKSNCNSQGFEFILSPLLSSWIDGQHAAVADKDYIGCKAGVRHHLKDALLEGEIPFNHAYGMTALEYPFTDPRFNKIFNNGMFCNSTIAMNKILDIYKGLQGLNSIVDVGGGTGAILNKIISKYPSIIKALNFDLPNVIQDAPFYPGIDHHHHQ